MPPNAKDARELAHNKILMLGDTGSGKSTQFLSLPGKKFAYLFDSNAILSLQGHDVEYEEFMPDKLSLSLTSLTKGKGDTTQAQKTTGAEVYRAWEEDFEKKIKDGYFKDIDWVMFDSMTTFSDLVMDGILAINGRGGQWPQQDDYGPQMLVIRNVVRTATTQGCGVYFTGHEEMIKDELTHTIYRQPVFTGKLRQKLPLLFSEIFHCEAQADAKTGKTHYSIQTQKDRKSMTIRTSIKGLKPFEDVTLDFTRPLEDQGLGGLLK